MSKVLCTKCFTCTSSLEHHVCSEHVCKECSMSFKTVSELINHSHVHISAEVQKSKLARRQINRPYFLYTCCRIAFLTKAELLEHQTSHKKKHEVHKCHMCCSLFKDLSDLKQHMFCHLTLSCPICSLKFGDLGDLTKHLAAHNIEKSSMCFYCGLKFGESEALEKHKCPETDDKPYCCPLCRKGFNNLMVLNLHLSVHTGDKPHVCPHCGVKHAELLELEDHLKTQHLKIPIQCSQCNQVSKRSSDLKCHMYTHTGEWPHTCPHCGKGFSAASHLYTHECSSHLKSHSITHMRHRFYVCSDCGKIFREKTLLDEHTFSHKGENPHVYSYNDTTREVKDHKCCNNAPKKQKQSQVHPEKDETSCLYCNIEFNDQLTLREHVACHAVSQKGDLPLFYRHRFYVCSHCGQIFMGKTLLKEHTLSHKGEKTHVNSCDDTKREVKGHKFCNNAPQKHMQSQIHPDKDETSCLYCDIEFNDQSTLREHVGASLNGDKSLFCPHCQKTFESLPLLKFHICIHTGDWSHTCDQCVEGFGDPSSLSKHMYTHTGLHHVCPHCGSGFTTQCRLDHHISDLHRSSLVCQFCHKRFITLSLCETHKHTHHKDNEASHLEGQNGSQGMLTQDTSQPF